MLDKDEWLSQYFEYGAYRYDAPFDRQNFPRGFIYAKIPAEKAIDTTLLIKNGFRFVETLVQFEQQKVFPYREQKEIQIEYSAPEDQTTVEAIAGKAFTFSRFYQDDKIPHLTANQIKSDWVSNYFAGKRGDKMIVARERGEVIAFLLLINRSTVDLIAVSPTHAGKGIASSMIRYANQSVGILKAGTQLINKPSIYLYEKSGFHIDKAYYILHKHNT